MLKIVLCAALLCISACKQRGGHGSSASKSLEGSKRFVFINGDEVGFGYCPKMVEHVSQNLGDAAKSIKVQFALSHSVLSQLDYLKQLSMQRDLAGIAIMPISPENLAIADALKKIKAAGVPVVTIFNDIETAGPKNAYRDYHVTAGSHTRTALAAAAKKLLELKGTERGPYQVFFSHTRNSEEVQLRNKALAEGLGTNFEAVYRGDAGDLSYAVQAVNTFFMKKDPEVNLLVAYETYYATYIADHLSKNKNLFDKYRVVTFGVDDRVRDLLRKGMVDAAIESGTDAGGTCALAYQALDALAKKAPTLPPALLADEHGVISSGAILVVPEKSKLLSNIEADDIRVMSISQYESFLK